MRVPAIVCVCKRLVHGEMKIWTRNRAIEAVRRLGKAFPANGTQGVLVVARSREADDEAIHPVRLPRPAALGAQ
jgi:hypothetical protein